MRKIILIIILLIGYNISPGLSQTREDINNITRDSVYCSIQNDSIKNYIKANIDNLLNMENKTFGEIQNIFNDFILLHNEWLTIYLAKNFNNSRFSSFIQEINDSLTINDINTLMKVAIYKARIGEKDTIIDGQKVTIIQGIFSFEQELNMESLQHEIGKMLQNRYQVSVSRPEQLTKKTTPRWYLEIINKAIREHPEKKKELQYLKNEIKNF